MSLNRALIAGLFAWLLALQGFALAASPDGHFTPTGAGGAQAVTLDGGACGSQRDGEDRHHGRHGLCCILACAACGSAYVPTPTSAAFIPERDIAAAHYALPDPPGAGHAPRVISSARGPPQAL